MAKILGPEMLLGAKSAANYLGVSVYQLRHAVENGLVKPTKIVETGKVTRRKYSVADLDEVKKRVWADPDDIQRRIKRERKKWLQEEMERSEADWEL